MTDEPKPMFSDGRTRWPRKDWTNRELLLELAAVEAAHEATKRELAEARAALSGKTWSRRPELDEVERAVVEAISAHRAKAGK